MNKLLPASVLLLLGMLPRIAESQLCQGYASPATAGTGTTGCVDLQPTLTWTFTALCINAGTVYDQLPAISATAMGECVLVPLPGGVNACPPQYSQYNDANGLYAITDAFDQELYGGACHNADLHFTDGSCPCAPTQPEPPPTEDDIDTNGEPNPTSPIVIRLGNGALKLTAAKEGVRFDLDADGTREQTAWTRAGSNDAFLVLDRNGNGAIDDGTELFGDHTPQVPSAEPNGFRALAVFDDPLNGGNGDGWIDEVDPIFRHLQLWIDSNHDGIAPSSELSPVAESNLQRIDLGYDTVRRVDAFGNTFLYRSRVTVASGGTARWAWDVFFRQ